MRTIKFLAIILVAVLVLDSCRKIEKLPNIPYIEFTSFAVFDTLDILGNINKAGRLKFYFEDGDGDVGLKQPSDIQPDTTNMFLTLFRKSEGTMILSNDKNDPLLPYSSYRIPYMERLGQNKILKGTISVTFLYQDYSPDDTIKYDFYIRDRALNESNVASTSEIIVSSNSIYTE
ncbi:MAG TPA: hypothetical protein VMV77_15785 [Bacteroidales bacterium]|nr:hypothetical protein [Bacteroidales bacterium]